MVYYERNKRNSRDKTQMKSDYANLHDDFIEIIHNPSLTNRCYLLRLTNYANERYSMMVNKEDLGKLANLINKFLEQQNEDQ